MTSTAHHDDSSSNSQQPPGISSVDLRRQAENNDNEPSPRFLQGDELQALRARVLRLSQELQSLRAQTSSSRRKSRSTRDARIQLLERAILKAQQVDAEYVYTVAKQRSDLARKQGQYTLAAHFDKQALEAKQALPQFQLQGLWVGKFNSSGKFELINVTYSDNDMLVAHKVTASDSTRDASSLPLFSVPLAADALGLPPIQLQPDAMVDAQLWGGQQYLPRFVGRGRVEEHATSTTIDDQGIISLGHLPPSSSDNVPLWVDGQLILVSEQYFAFYWLGTSEQVFFGRPSPELTLKLLRQTTDPVREHLQRCWLETELIQDDLEVEGYKGVDDDSANPDDFYSMEGCFE